MPGLVKIGYSTKDPILRAKELAGTGNPHSYRLVFDLLVENPRDVEKATHAKLRGEREGKEWFRCSHAVAIEAIRSCAGKALLERSSVSLESDSVPIRKKEEKCGYYGCGKTALNGYKGAWYCAEHAKVMRAHRFAIARRLRDGEQVIQADTAPQRGLNQVLEVQEVQGVSPNQEVKDWHRGKYDPLPEDDQNSGVVFISPGYYGQPLLAKVTGGLDRFYIKHWQWLIGAALAIIGMVVAF